jgi:hypothetical protein
VRLQDYSVFSEFGFNLHPAGLGGKDLVNMARVAKDLEKQN